MKKIMSLVVILAMLFAPAAFAGSPWTKSEGYLPQVGGKLVFGLANSLLGWTDVVATPVRYAGDGKNIWAGVGQGLVDGVTNTAGGLFHLVTFPIPIEIVLPHDGVDLGGR
jgi:hypothetical protein